MAEMRVTSIILLLVCIGLVGFLVLTFGGWMAVGWFNKKTADDLFAGAKGYASAKTPSEAMDGFHKAIQNREYKIAGEKYCTKAYAELLSRSNTNAANLGGDLDRIREFGKNQEKGSLMTDKLLFLLHTLDPYPKNFKLGPAPKQDGETKATGTFIWEPLIYKTPTFKIEPSDLQAIDVKMYKNVLVGNATLGGTMAVNLVKEGDAWKLDIPTNPAWDLSVNYFNEKSPTYHVGLKTFVRDMSNERYDTPRGFEHDVITKLTAAKD
jgi:hypothetical protein